jgi:hypothetical protein
VGFVDKKFVCAYKLNQKQVTNYLQDGRKWAESEKCEVNSPR